MAGDVSWSRCGKRTGSWAVCSESIDRLEDCWSSGMLVGLKGAKVECEPACLPSIG